MESKEKYIELCKKNEDIPIFSRSWWMDAVCDDKEWNVILIENGGQIVASLPYYFKNTRRGIKISQPILTQKNGVWIRYPKNQKEASKISFERKILRQIICKLNELNISTYSQHFDYKFSNWLPFYWDGFNQTTRYTYVLEDLTDVNSIYDGIDSKTKNSIRKAEKIVKIKYDLDIKKFYEINKKTFEKQNLKIPYSMEIIEKIDKVCTQYNCRKILYAEDNQGKIHAAVYIIWDKNSAYYLMGGLDPELSSSDAMSLLIWESIKFSSSVTKKFDFEGSMIQSIERFFSSFGGVQKQYFLISKDFEVDVFREFYKFVKCICKNSPFVRKIYKLTRRK